jgi:hypothetical protein
VGHAPRDDLGLAGAGTGNDQQRAAGVQDGVALLRGEVVWEIRRDVHRLTRTIGEGLSNPPRFIRQCLQVIRASAGTMYTVGLVITIFEHPLNDPVVRIGTSE